MKWLENADLPICFRLTLSGSWSTTKVDVNDYVRVIGTFKKSNHFKLSLEDSYQENDDKLAKFIIVEPIIMISATQIVRHHCDRNSVLADKFKLNSSTYLYPILLGNIIHEVFEKIMIS